METLFQIIIKKVFDYPIPMIIISNQIQSAPMEMGSILHPLMTIIYLKMIFYRMVEGFL